MITRQGHTHDVYPRKAAAGTIDLHFSYDPHMFADDSAISRVLVLSARLDSSPEQLDALARAAAKIGDWNALAPAAESHGLAPLLLSHLDAARVAPPQEARRALRALAMRHRDANRIRIQALREILEACADRDIEVRVLKGAALAHLVYPSPAMRPMRDLDVLVHQRDAVPTQRLLGELGYDAPVPDDGRVRGKHLPVASCRREGLTVSVEVHTNLFAPLDAESLTLGEASGSPLEFAIDGTAAATLGREDMLWHLARHMVTFDQSLRLISAVDVRAVARRYATEIDWRELRRAHPGVMDSLAMLHHLNAFDAEFLAAADLEPGLRPGGVGEDYDGWPRAAYHAARRTGDAAGIVVRTLRPSEWWLRLYYGCGRRRPAVWYRWIVHPLYLARWAATRLRG
jgi:hypothetical protein